MATEQPILAPIPIRPWVIIGVNAGGVANSETAPEPELSLGAHEAAIPSLPTQPGELGDLQSDSKGDGGSSSGATTGRKRRREAESDSDYVPDAKRYRRTDKGKRKQLRQIQREAPRTTSAFILQTDGGHTQILLKFPSELRRPVARDMVPVVLPYSLRKGLPPHSAHLCASPSTVASAANVWFGAEPRYQRDVLLLTPKLRGFSAQSAHRVERRLTSVIHERLSSAKTLTQ